jgi:hypothetical protein
MNMLLKQARKGYKASILENSQTITLSILADPADPWSVVTTKTFTGRIAHEKKAVSNLETGTAGLSTNLGKFLMVEYNINYLVVGMIITDANSKDWKLGSIDPLEKFGGVHGYQCPLEEAV